MTATIKVSKAAGSVAAPPSKSVAHRSLICGAFSEKSIIKNIEYSADILATLSCLEALGARVEKRETSVEIGGLNPKNIPENAELFCNESGSTLRFMVPICLLSGKEVTLKGAKRLFERPLSVYEEIFEKNGVCYQKGEDFIKINGLIEAGDYFVKGDISSQFITGLMFALPLMEKTSSITVTGKFESESYIDLTVKVLKGFGIEIERSENTYKIKSGTYKSKEYTVEGDYSNAAFLDAFNLLGGDVTVSGLDENSVQGDRVYKKMFEQLNGGTKDFDLSDCPDLAPIMFALAAVKGGAHFTGTARLKIKESDRAEVMKEELKKFGITLRVEPNDVYVEKGDPVAPTEILCGHNDHRIVMSLAVLCTITGGKISGCEAINKSFPDFFNKISSLKVGVDLNEN